MSWIRWGSACDNGLPYHPSDDACMPDGKRCPGSDVYVFEHVDGGIECCGCSLLKDDLGSYRAKDEDEMRAHLREHVAAGHHVRPALMITEDQWRKDTEGFTDGDMQAKAQEAFVKSMARMDAWSRLWRQHVAEIAAEQREKVEGASSDMRILFEAARRAWEDFR